MNGLWMHVGTDAGYRIDVVSGVDLCYDKKDETKHKKEFLHETMYNRQDLVRKRFLRQA